jgi:hypothetical protein
MGQILETWKVMPHGALESLDDGILTVAGDMPMPLGNFPRRMTVVGLPDRTTLIFSAIALGDAEMEQIERLGEPSVLVVPSGSHRTDARIWTDRYPRLRVIAPPGTAKDVGEVVGVDATEFRSGDGAVLFETVPGTDGHEGALVVRRTGGVTLICNDLIGNVAHPHGIGAHVMARLMGFGVSAPQIPRVVKHKLISDPAALAAKFREWAAEPDLRRIVVSHGDVIGSNAREVLLTLADALA